MAVAIEKLIRNKHLDKEALVKIMEGFWNTKVVLLDAILEPATSRGNNFISDAWIIRFEHRRGEPLEDVPRDTSILARQYSSVRKDGIYGSIFVKSKRDSDEYNILMSTDVAFKNEIYAYEKIIANLNNYSNGNIRVPIYVFGDTNNIVLEDMGNKAFKSMNRKYVTSWNQVWSPIQEMARLHAASIVMKKLDKKLFAEMIKEIKQVPLNDTLSLAAMQASTIDTTIEILRLTKGSKAKDEIKILQNLRDDAWNKQREIINENVPVMVVNHGNFWINNLVYREDMIVLFDWQHIVYSSPATDLCFFLYVNFATAFLTNQRKALLDFYLMHLHQSIYDVCAKRYLKLSDIDELLEPLTYEWIDSELKRCSLCGYMMAQWINPIFYWSEAVFDMMEKVGGMENMSVEKRLENMTSEQKDRVIQLTNVFLKEYQTIN